MPVKAGMLAKKVKLATAWREANCSRENKNITASTAEGRLITTRMPEKASAGTPTAQYGCQQHIMDTDSTMWKPTIYEFLRKFAKKKLVRVAKKFVKKKC
jgi:hypothetical protein